MDEILLILSKNHTGWYLVFLSPFFLISCLGVLHRAEYQLFAIWAEGEYLSRGRVFLVQSHGLQCSLERDESARKALGLGR